MSSQLFIQDVQAQKQYELRLSEPIHLAVCEPDSPLDQLCNLYVRALDDLSRLGPIYNDLFRDISTYRNHIERNVGYLDSIEQPVYRQTSTRDLATAARSIYSQFLLKVCDRASRPVGHNRRELDPTMTLKAQLNMLIEWAQARFTESADLLCLLQKNTLLPLTDAQVREFDYGQEFFSHAAFPEWVRRLIEQCPRDSASLVLRSRLMSTRLNA